MTSAVTPLQTRNAQLLLCGGNFSRRGCTCLPKRKELLLRGTSCSIWPSLSTCSLQPAGGSAAQPGGGRLSGAGAAGAAGAAACRCGGCTTGCAACERCSRLEAVTSTLAKACCAGCWAGWLVLNPACMCVYARQHQGKASCRELDSPCCALAKPPMPLRATPPRGLLGPLSKASSLSLQRSICC